MAQLMILPLFPLLALAMQTDPLAPDIGCVTAQISPATREAIVAEMSGGTAGPVRQAFRDAAFRCRDQRSWPEDYTASIGMLAAARLAADALSGRLTRGGVDVAAIDSWLATAPLPAQPDGAEMTAAVEALQAHLLAAGLEQSRLEANAELIGQYVGAHHAALEVRRELDVRRAGRQ